MIIHLIAQLIKKMLYKNESIFSQTFGGDINVKVNLSNYARKADLENSNGVDTSKLAAKSDLASLKAEVSKINLEKLKTAPIDLSKLKSKEDKLDVDELAPVPVDLFK